MSESLMMQIDGIEKSYGGDFQLTVQSLAFEKRRVFCLLGPTGSGKSTLLRLIAAIESPTVGRVRLDGTAVHDNGSALASRRRMAMVFQRPVLLNSTVRANVEYGLGVRGILEQNIAKIDRILERLKLAKLHKQAAYTLSGGQTQLVALARALVIEPELLILDEPTANLDPAHVALVEDVVAEAKAEQNTTVVWATHNMFQARRVADRVALLLDGEIVEEAAADKFFDAPSDSRTAEFVEGRMIY